MRCAICGEAGVQENGELSVDVHVDSDVGTGSRKKIDERKSGGALAENTGDACVEHGRSRGLRSHHGIGRGSEDAVGVDGLGVKRATSSLDTFQRCQSGRLEELRYLWLQDMTMTGGVNTGRVLAELNWADHF